MAQSSVEQRLERLGLTIPGIVDPPAGSKINFAPARRSGTYVYLSGNGPVRGGDVVYRGKLGREVSMEQGYDAARLTGLNLLSVLKAEIDDLDRVIAWIKVLGFIASAPGFNDHPAVLNGFSDLIVEVFGSEIGMHARSAVGVAELPWDTPVEIEAIVKVRT